MTMLFSTFHGIIFATASCFVWECGAHRKMLPNVNLKRHNLDTSIHISIGMIFAILSFESPPINHHCTKYAVFFSLSSVRLAIYIWHRISFTWVWLIIADESNMNKSRIDRLPCINFITWAHIDMAFSTYFAHQSLAPTPILPKCTGAIVNYTSLSWSPALQLAQCIPMHTQIRFNSIHFVCMHREFVLFFLNNKVGKRLKCSI